LRKKQAEMNRWAILERRLLSITHLFEIERNGELVNSTVGETRSVFSRIRRSEGKRPFGAVRFTVDCGIGRIRHHLFQESTNVKRQSRIEDERHGSPWSFESLGD